VETRQEPRRKGTNSLNFARKRLVRGDLVYNLLSTFKPKSWFLREGTRSADAVRSPARQKYAMSKLFETLRRLEKDPDGVALDSPMQTIATLPATPPPLPAPIERPVAVDRSVPIEPPAPIVSERNLSIRWPVEPVARTVEDEAPAERVGSRLVAIGIDAGMILIALALFVGVFFLSGGILTLEKDLPLLGSVLVILALFYCFLCLLGNQGSPGMSFVGVRGDASQMALDQSQLGLRQIAPSGPSESVPVARLRTALNVPAPVRPIIEDLVTANRILANENVLEAYGSVSVRDERNSDRFFLARQVNGNRVTAGDVVEYELDGTPVSINGLSGHADCSLHSEIYKARPDVMAIVHWRAADIIPFTASSVCLRPVSQTAAFLAEGVPVIEGGKTDPTGMTVRPRATAKMLAEGLSDKPAALLRGQGAIVVAASLHGAVARAYYMNMNARLQIQAIQLGGEVNYVAPAESPVVTADEYEPAWEFFRQRLPVNGTHH
jgi:ribulose-5-phosphate 4-epimerase/fuculose-1-phosphate aldolase